MKIIIKPKKITRKNFKKFGDVISTKKIKSININDGYAKRFNDLCRINTSSKKGSTIVSIFSAKKRKFPMNIKMMEKHSLGSQAFIPMEETTFLVFVAPKGKKPNIKKLKSFIIPEQIGINYRPGIWHFPLISTKNMNFLVIDRKGKGNNLTIHNFKNEKISLKYKK
jgi:ureidoglycolate lyase|tara:strand:+ start:774 stop:1274 length:501 start_codon:yes stop_codon:yes gene_type:complete